MQRLPELRETAMMVKFRVFSDLGPNRTLWRDRLRLTSTRVSEREIIYFSVRSTLDSQYRHQMLVSVHAHSIMEGTEEWCDMHLPFLEEASVTRMYAETGCLYQRRAISFAPLEFVDWGKCFLELRFVDTESRGDSEIP